MPSPVHGRASRPWGRAVGQGGPGGPEPPHRAPRFGIRTPSGTSESAVCTISLWLHWLCVVLGVLKVFTYYKEHVHILSTSAWHTHGTHMAHYMAHSWHTTWHTGFYGNSHKIKKRASEGSFQGFNTYTIKRSVPCSVP